MSEWRKRKDCFKCGAELAKKERKDTPGCCRECHVKLTDEQFADYWESVEGR